MARRWSNAWKTTSIKRKGKNKQINERSLRVKSAHHEMTIFMQEVTMLQSNYPLFNKGRILKIEMLEALRDMPRSIIHTTYDRFEEGILQGLCVSIDGNEIHISPGLLKSGHQILVMEQPAVLSYHATDELTRLVITVEQPDETPDIQRWTAVIRFTSTLQQEKNQWELMRFKLKQGAHLRTEYQSFADLTTEYNTVNPIHRKNALEGQYGVSAQMLELFCTYAQQATNSQPLDQLFCLQILQNSSTVSLKATQYYIAQRLNEQFSSSDPKDIHRKLTDILRLIQQDQQQVHAQGIRNRKLIVE